MSDQEPRYLRPVRYHRHIERRRPVIDLPVDVDAARQQIQHGLPVALCDGLEESEIEVFVHVP